MSSPAFCSSSGLWTLVPSKTLDMLPLASKISLFEGPNLGSPTQSASCGVIMLFMEYPVSIMIDGYSRSFQ